MNNIRIFLCCHNRFSTIPPLCEPLQCGSALNPPIDGALQDCIGQNISAKNREYCELTAHYFAWKNIKADFYGFCHYRRFFGNTNITTRPYLAAKKISSDSLISEQELQNLCKQYSIIAPRAENMGLSVRKHYETSRFHYKQDLDLFLKLLSDGYPQLNDSIFIYMNQNKQYLCNMFVMNAELFRKYCEILFCVLKQFDDVKELHGDFQSDRTNGYLGEIFTGIFILYCNSIGEKIFELPRIDNECTLMKRISCVLFPPESRRRFVAKALVKRIRRY